MRGMGVRVEGYVVVESMEMKLWEWLEDGWQTEINQEKRSS